jgi:diaminopimelate epimerase
MTERRTIRFTKMQGCGNDYIYVDTSAYDTPDPQAVAVAWSRRHTGIGSDGLVLIGRSSVPEADFTMRIFNADGSEAMMCGNACRCIGKYVYERGLTDKTDIRLLTPSGIKMLRLNLDIRTGCVESVTVDMGTPVFLNSRQYIPTGDAPAGTFVSMGNPHYVIFVEDVSTIDVATEGRRLEHHPQFPERSNIEFAEVRPEGIRMRVWERGSGITMACGTGACATAVAAALTHRTGRHSKVIMDGGSLDIEWRQTDDHILMSGPASFVYDGELTFNS